MFLAKYSASTGTYQWVVKAGGTSSDYGRGMAISSGGDIYITGIFTGTAAFGSYNVTATGGCDIFLAKYNTSGVCQWVRRMGGSGYDYGNKVAIAPDGSVYVTGYFQNTSDFGSFNLTSAGGQDLFLAKYNSSGTCQWVRQGSSTESVSGEGVATDGTNVYVSGYFGASTVNFSGTILTSAGGTDAFLVNYNTSGTLQWAKRGGDANSDIGYRCSVDGSGNAYMIGSFSNNITFESTTITSAGSDDIFIVSYNPSGNLFYLMYAGGSNQAWGRGIAIGSDGYAYCMGTIFGWENTFYFDAQTLAPTRNAVWTARLSPPYLDIGLKIFDGTSNVTIACEPGTATSRLRIAKGGVVYGIALVLPADPMASRVRIQTPDGIRALRKY
jgi:hypothetical protein